MLKKFRQKVHNKARVEASIAEGFLVEEISNITSFFLPELISNSSNHPHRYAQSGLPSNCTLSLFQVRIWKTGRGVPRTLTVQEYKTAIIYIFTNLSEMDEYVQKFEQEKWRRPRPPSQKQLDKLRMNGAGNDKPDLLDWFRSLAKEKGRQVSEVEAWVYTHRGPNSEEVESLNTKEATACLESYKAKAMELNGPEFDWLHSLIDVKALYECCCGRQHGKWPLFNGTIDDSNALTEVTSSRASSMAAKRRREEAERTRKEVNDSRAAMEYAQNMLEWGRMVQKYNENIQRFMENVAAHTGMSAAAVPPPLPPPPLPPMYGLPTSLNQSHEKVCIFCSSVGVETPEETLNAHGGFGGRVTITGNEVGGPSNGAGSGGGNYSPPL